MSSHFSRNKAPHHYNAVQAPNPPTNGTSARRSPTTAPTSYHPPLHQPHPRPQQQPLSSRIKWSSKPSSRNPSPAFNGSRHYPNHYHQPQPQEHPPSAPASAYQESLSRAESRAGSRSDSLTTVPPRSKRGMTGMLDIDRPHTRRDRTFAGSECAACEEPLEHTLRGEKVLQLSCGHVAHEACFYEYIREFDSQLCPSCDAPLGLDSSRGGNVLDLDKLAQAIRAQSIQDEPPPHQQQHPQHHQQQYPPHHPQQHSLHDPSHQHQYQQSGSDHHYGRESRAPSSRPSDRSQPYANNAPRRINRHSASSRGHTRGESNGTGVGSAGDSEYGNRSSRRHDSDYPSMDAPTASPRLHQTGNPIPAPSVFIRSEYPTLSKSRQQQSLTCLITVEVPEGKWKPNADDLKKVYAQTQAAAEHHRQSRISTHRRVDSSIPEQPEESPEFLEEMDQLTENLIARVDNWHGLDYNRFGRLRLHGTLHVGKDRQSWQQLECFLFAEMLICVKEKRLPQDQQWAADQVSSRCTLKGSIMIKKHLADIEESMDDDNILTLSLSVPELPTFHLQFLSTEELEIWRDALFHLSRPDEPDAEDCSDNETIMSTEYDDGGRVQPMSGSSWGANAHKSYATTPTEYSDGNGRNKSNLSFSLHVPIDIVLVIPLSPSMHGLKITLLRDMLQFLLYSMGERDRVGLVSFGGGGGAVPIVGMTTKSWHGWNKVVDSIKASGSRSSRADPVEGANVAMDILMQRRTANPISSIMVVSDSATAEDETVDFVVSRAEAARVSIYTFGLGLTHKPDALISMSQRTKAAYIYVKDWMMLRECVAGVLGSLQSICHQNVVLKLRLPDGSPGRFSKISGALLATTRATGREAEASLGDLRFGEKRDVLVQLAIAPETGSDRVAHDPWESMVSNLEALGGAPDADSHRPDSVEEVPMIQADLRFGDILRDGAVTQTPRPSLLTITVLPVQGRTRSTARPPTPPIPPHPSVVQRRMELLTSDMLTRALTLVSRGSHDRAHHLLQETRSILKGLGKGGLPPLPPPTRGPSRATLAPSTASGASARDTASPTPSETPATQPSGVAPGPTPASPPPTAPLPPPPSLPALSNAAVGIDYAIMGALDAELESALEWINHPAVFARDSRKAVLQTIGVTSSQRAYTFRTQLEVMWAERILGIRAMSESAKAWGEGDGAALSEEG